MRAVFARTEAWLDGLDPAELTRVVIDAAVPAADRQHLQRPGRRPRGHHPPRRHRVLDLPARPAPHGRDRARPRPRRPPRDDLLGPFGAFCVAKAVRFGGSRDRERSTGGRLARIEPAPVGSSSPVAPRLRSQHSVCARIRPVRSPPTDVRVSPRRPARAYAGDRTAKPIQRSAGTRRAERPREKPKDLPWRRKHRRREGRHDPGLGRRQPRRPRHRAQGRAAAGRAGQDRPSATATPPSRSPSATRRPRKLTKPEAGHFAKAGVEPGIQPRRAAPRRRRRLRGRPGAQRRPARRRRPRRRHRRQQGQGLRRRHEAPQLRRPAAPATAPTASTARPARSAPAPRPARVFKGTRMAGRMGGEKVTTLNLEVVAGRRRARPPARQGRRPGPEGRPRARPQRRQGRGEEVAMATVTVRTAAGADAGTVELDDADLRHRAQRPGDAPGRHRPARRPPRRHAEHQDPRRGRAAAAPSRGSRRAPAAPARARSASPHWRGGGVALGPKPRSYAQRTPKKMIRLALRSALSDRAAEGKVLVVDDWGFDAPKHQGRRWPRSPRSASTGRVLVVLDRDDDVAVEELPQPARTCSISTPASSTPTTCSCNDWVVFTQDTLPRPPVARRPPTTEEAHVKDPRDVIIEPVVSEKSYALLERERLHVPRAPRAPASPRSTTPSRRSSA